MSAMWRFGWLVVGLLACSAPKARPCLPNVPRDEPEKLLEELAKRIELPPEDEALRHPKSIADLRAILHRDTVYLFGEGARVAHAMDTLEARQTEASFELLLGESQLLAAQVLNTQEAWVGADLRIARANLAVDGADANDRARMLAELVGVVEDGNAIEEALGRVALRHLQRAAELVRRVRAESPSDARTLALVAEYHRLRGEWREFDAAMNATDKKTRAFCYLRGMEQLERHRKPDAGAAVLRECLATFPRFVRAQAGLVLMATTPAEALREIEALRRMNEDHYLVMLLQPTITADQELFRMRRDARP